MPFTASSPLLHHFRTWIVIALSLICTTGHTDPPEISYFSKATEFQQIKISPDGKHLAVLGPADGKKIVAILKLDTLGIVSVARFDNNRQVGEFYWANNERLILRLEIFEAWYDHPVSAGEWFAVNVNGKRGKYIFGYRGGISAPVGFSAPDSTYGYGELVDLLPDNPKEVLISSEPFSRAKERSPSLYRVNIYTGRKKFITRSPVPNATFLTDHSGRARFVSGINSESKLEVHYRNSETGNWQAMNPGDSESRIIPLAFADKDTVYILDDQDSSLQGLFKLHLKTGAQDLIYRHDSVNPSNFWFSDNGRELFALEVEPGLPSYVYVDQENPDAKLLKGLLKAFPGKQIRLESQTEDGNLSIIRVFSDLDPGVYYLYDRQKNTAQSLVSARPWVNPELSATVKPITFTSRDGLTIHGFLTLPAGKEARNLPLVVVPHGGPHFVRDWWGYDPETQLLASRGMAVLQVNFRGSEGYGRDFEVAGYRHWGDTVQHDIIDGTRYVIEQGIVDENHICIYGSSFGAYSAMQSAIIAPELFVCAVGHVGIYDLQMMHEIGDISQRESGEAYLERVIGTDPVELRAFSPVHHVDKLKASVMLIHGEEDERAPIDHAEALRDALNARGYYHVWLTMKKEGHGFYSEKNREDMYRQLLGYLGSQLKLNPVPGN